MELVTQRHGPHTSTLSLLNVVYNGSYSGMAVEMLMLDVNRTGGSTTGTLDVQLDGDKATFNFQRTLRNVVTPAICAFGCIGNVTNLIVLTHIRLRKADGGKDNGSHLGLILLAISDVLFCTAMFPRGFVPENESLFTRFDFWLIYQVYGTGVVTTFILTSTWLTVIMAMLRYIGICQPFPARRIDGPFFAKSLYFVVFTLCVLLNLPSFFHYRISTIELQGRLFYLIDIGYIDVATYVGRAFTITKATVGIFIPIILLVFCNCSLIRALKNSYRVRRQFHVQETVSKTSNRITLTLIIIIIAFMSLVIPCEVMDFFTDTIRLNAARTEIFLFLRSVGNVCQIINFSFNFILYCVINVHFRSVLLDLFVCNGKVMTGSARIHNRGVARNMSARTSTTQLSTSPGRSQQVHMQRTSCQ